MSFLFMLIGYLATVAIAAIIIKHLPFSKDENPDWLVLTAVVWPIAVCSGAISRFLRVFNRIILGPFRNYFSGD